MRTGTANITIDRPPAEVWRAVADVTRMGEWSPECIATRWAGGATGPEVGATFEGDNIFTIAGRTVYRWTTTSEITVCEPGESFEFVSAGMTTWRYDLQPAGNGTAVTETFSYEPKGFQKMFYDVLLRRSKGMTKGMQRTLQRLKASLESAAGRQ